MLPPLGDTPPLYCKTVDISGKKSTRKSEGYRHGTLILVRDFNISSFIYFYLIFSLFIKFIFERQQVFFQDGIRNL